MKNTERAQTRKNEILDAAEKLFLEKGYEHTAVSDILSEAGIAKGSLYYHYKSKEDVLDDIIARVTEQIAVAAQAVADAPSRSVHEKMLHLISSMNISNSAQSSMIEELHRPVNALLHQKSIAQTIHIVAPIIAGVVEQGIEEGLYRTPYPLETVEILLVAGQFIFDEAIFHWTPEESAGRMKAFISLAECALGAAPDSFHFLAGGHIDEQ